MLEIQLIKIIEDAMDLHGADGLWNGNGPCGCGRGDLNPGDCMSVDCALAKSKIATEDDVDDCIEVGDTVWFPIQIRATALAPNPRVQPPPTDAANPAQRSGVGCDGLLGADVLPEQSNG